MIKTTPTGQDLEQQLDNILSFVTQPSDTNSTPTNENSQQNTLNKALYYLKNNQNALAAKWMRLAAMSGELRAQFYLGLFFVKGQGVPQSVFHAVAWLSLSSSQGHEPATTALTDLRKHIETKRFKDAQCYAASLYEQIHQLKFSHLIPNNANEE
ncbi:MULTISPECIES: tetratricopeptide repeat protein [Pseudoalteromonas]|uniref:Sel1 repeat family protein n=1 Tax=Pseudoalteromonas fuliginea TaxID=1872678 RepID=A0ABQ6RM27_9GAMM|nr:MULTISPECIES: SEL1-like repeat protein [Pseudoalteromonas]KAA1164157.1 sel1 repeat family protein [Pseudoalteromonas fuliginea]KAA1168976.1 sel1 repeat family protein [Pseudoalteromonas fuliginea]MDQ2043978.1 SEL1-like repeat protein [Pseudoalteromonas sp. 20-92]